MKILYYFAFDNTPMTNWQNVHIVDELYHHGIVVEVFNPLDYTSIEESNEKLFLLLNSDKTIDMFMTPYVSKHWWEKGALQLLKSVSIPKLLIRFDNLHLVDNINIFADVFDLVWLTSRENIQTYINKGCHAIFAPYAANPYCYRIRHTADIGKVCFIGSPYGSRTRLINTLINQDVNVDLYYSSKRDSKRIDNNSVFESKYERYKTLYDYLYFSVGRKILMGKLKSMIGRKYQLDEDNNNLCHLESLSFEKMNEAYSNYNLSLNVLDLRSTAYLKNPVHKLHLRTFEIPMCGGLEFVSYDNELIEYFSEDEMVFYHDETDMIEKAKFYTDPKQISLCHRMKVHARRRAENEHTWMNRFQMIFKVLNLKY